MNRDDQHRGAKLALIRRRRRRSNQGGLPLIGMGLAGISLLILVVLGAGAGAAYGVYRSFADDLVEPEAILDSQRALGTSRIYDRDGNRGTLLYEFADPLSGLRNPVRLSEVSQYLIDATVATEDASFWENEGINLRGLSRAAWENLGLGSGDFLGGSGGSSITQQLVKNVLIPQDERSGRTLDRVRGKLKETILAVELTDKYSKEQILEWYLNTIFYGNLSYGIGAASQQYFGKPASQLTLPEAALLVGLPQAPAVFDPYTNLPAAKARQAVVLDLMARHGYVTQLEAEAAKDAPLRFSSQQFDIIAPHFVFYVRDQVVALCAKGRIPLPDTVPDCSSILAEGGLRITTSLDMDLQRKAEDILRTDLAAFEAETGGHNAALVSLDVPTGEIRAMVGSRDYFLDEIDGQVNLATGANSPGSSIKPITYVAAFLQDPKTWNPGTIIWDVPVKFVEADGSVFSPVNFDAVNRGPVTLRSALANSMNIPAFRTADTIGIPHFLDIAHRIGITTLRDPANYGPSITLGGGDVSLLDLTYAYSVFANNGEMRGERTVLDLPPGYRPLDPVSILEIRDSRGQLVYRPEQTAGEQVIPAPHAYQITSILSDNNARSILYGLNSTLVLDRPAAAKTGTAGDPGRNDDRRDYWTLGYTPQIVTGVWVGNADNSPMTGGSSSRTAGQIWHDFMLEAHEGLPALEFQEPDGLTRAEVYTPQVRALLAGEDRAAVSPQNPCGAVRQDIFVAEGGVPEKANNVCFEARVDLRTLREAGEGAEGPFIAEGVFLIPPTPPGSDEPDPEMVRWLRQNKVQYVGAGGPGDGEFEAPLQIDLPRDGGTLGQGLVLVSGRAASPDMLHWILAYAPGEAPADAEFVQLVRSDVAVRGGQLTRWETVNLEPGPYTLRLTVVDDYLGTLELDVHVTIENADGEDEDGEDGAPGEDGEPVDPNAEPGDGGSGDGGTGDGGTGDGGPGDPNGNPPSDRGTNQSQPEDQGPPGPGDGAGGGEDSPTPAN